MSRLPAASGRLLPRASAALPTELRGWVDRVSEGEPWTPPVRSRVCFAPPVPPVFHGRACRFTVELWERVLEGIWEDWTVHLPTAGHVHDFLRALPFELVVREPYWIRRHTLRADLVVLGEDGTPYVCGHLYARAAFVGVQPPMLPPWATGAR